MLPLWIIDLTQPSVRRDAFARLVGTMSHVAVHPDAGDDLRNDADGADAGCRKEYVGDLPAGTSLKSDLTPEELAEERRAERRSNIKGDYWLYSQMPFDPPAASDAAECAAAVYEYQERIVREGGRFIRMLRKSNAEPFRTVNIAVLGDITESSSQALFASLASLLQKEKGRILPHHIHQGMEVTGMLFVPCDVNSHDVCRRRIYKRMLHEIETCRENPGVRGYDRMMLYQDVQNRTQCSYPLLDGTRTAEYLFQCIVHMYYACNAVHPLISGTSSADNFYMSMGAVSVFFDMALEDERDRRRVASQLFEAFRTTRRGERTADPAQRLATGEFLDIQCMLWSINDLEPIDFDSLRLPPPDPDPVRDMIAPALKKKYYQGYLRHLPMNFMREVYARVDDSTRAALHGMAAARKRATANTTQALRAGLRKVIRHVTPDSGALGHIEDELTALQQNISAQRSAVRRELEGQLWDRVTDNFIPASARQSFDDYHSSYLADMENPRGDGGACAEMKEEAVKDLADHLGRQPTGMAVASRCIVGGIMFALAAVPVLAWLSAQGIVDLGRVRRFAGWWYVAMFFVPAAAEAIKAWLRRRRTKSLLQRLRTYLVHDAYARVACRIENETGHFYDAVSALCGRYLDRIRRIRRRGEAIDVDPAAERRELPQTTFARDLLGEPPAGLIPPDWVEYSRIRVAGSPVAVRNLSDNNYFTLINSMSDLMLTLFDDLGEAGEKNLVRDDDEQRMSGRFLPAEELEALDEERWRGVFARFADRLLEAVGKDMLPRECPTVGDNIRRYYRETRSAEFLRAGVEYAATNGEITSAADAEYADVKTGRPLADILADLLPQSNLACQTDGHDPLLRRYLFITRWRSFDRFSLNRLLPREDFDDEIRRRRVAAENESADQADRFPLSSVIIASLSPDDEPVAGWFRLFAPEDYGEAQRLRREYRRVLNTND